jgi:hypothetical protein
MLNLIKSTCVIIIHFQKNLEISSFIDFSYFPDYFLMVIGGFTGSFASAEVELVSLDAKNNPVPSRLQKLGNFPSSRGFAHGALFRPCKYHRVGAGVFGGPEVGALEDYPLLREWGKGETFSTGEKAILDI